MWLLGKLVVQSLGALGVVVAPATVPRRFRPLDEGMTCVPGSQEGVPVLLLETTLLTVHTCALGDLEQWPHKQPPRNQDLGAPCPPGGHPTIAGGRR